MVALLDSGVIAGFLDRDDAFHAAAERRLRRLAGRAHLIVSVITYAELLTGAALGHHDTSAVRGFFSHLIDAMHVVDATIAERAAELRGASPALRMPDALILATADVHDADLIISGDRRLRGLLGERPRVELLHPT